METFLEFLREVLKGIVREISAYFFRKKILGSGCLSPPEQSCFTEMFHDINVNLSPSITIK